jgi:hypothetical protein
MADSTFLLITITSNGLDARVGLSESDALGKVPPRTSYDYVDVSTNEEEVVELVAAFVQRRLALQRLRGAQSRFLI